MKSCILIIKFQTYKKTFGGILKQPWMMINEPENFYSSLLRKADFEVLRCENKITTDYLTEKELHGAFFNF